ncbi:ATP-binding protein [Actinotalea sp. M2MS4P-6]|uniref:ATP-binding protein n=1 Tax=Actinotalea sp. M2MS4P-6 TaxID=2983762 RepID=UPI0021E462B5|nr:ATP-binding protein [Actinotalea sp. M2MS4P-6]MCV2395225.1 ATP-binding protein [Actinotalea sp. M2MS4P-6]
MRERLVGLVKAVQVGAERRQGADPITRARLDAVLGVLAEEHVGHDPAAQDRMAGLADVFDLDPQAVDLLTVAAAPDLDPNIALAFGLLRGGTAPARASVGLALELVGLPTASGAGHEHLGAGAPLRRHGLAELAPGPWLARDLWVPDRVLAHLVGVDRIDPALAPVVVDPVPLPELDPDGFVAAAVEAGAPLVWIRSPLGAGGLSLAAGALAAAGVGCLAIDLARVPPGTPPGPLVAQALLEAALRGAGVVVVHAERVAEGDPAVLFTALAESVVPVLAVGEKPWQPAWLPFHPLVVEAPAVTTAHRRAVWDDLLGAEVADHDLSTLRLAPESIADAARYATTQALVAGTEVSSEAARAAARRVAGSMTSGPAQAPRRAPSFDDLVLPDHAAATLRRLVSWASHREEVLADGRLVDVGGKGTGLAALFSGSPGTGKTLAAHVVAAELGLDLFRVDLASIVDKYIGETEKNLERVFHEAESLHVLLFFDEADALFGKRSDVKDAHDRYANQEVAYLLQRMESFDGITVLATNLHGNLDPAFSRRMSFIVHFPDPDEATRRQLWQAHLDRVGTDPADPVDVAHLARQVELAGGDIRNIVLAAAYDAIAAGEVVGMRHVLAALVAEFQKLGRRVPVDGFAPSGTPSERKSDDGS